MQKKQMSQPSQGKRRSGLRVCGISLLLIFAMVLPTGCSLFKFKRRSSAKERRAAKKAAREKQKAEALKTFPAWVKGSCDGAAAAFFKKYYKFSGRDIRNQAAVKLAKCGDWKPVFERLFVSNRGWALSMLQTLEATQLKTPVYEAMAQWIQNSEQPFRFRMGFYSADFMRYAIDKSPNKSKYCKAYYLSAKKAPKIRIFRTRSKVRRYGLGFMMVGGCKQYRRFVVSQLSSRWWIDRKIACEVLGRWGEKSALRKVSILASTDPFIHRNASRKMRRPIYSVRIACRAAAGRIRMSN